MGGPTPKAYLERHALRFGQGDIFNQQADQPFAVMMRGMRIIPYRWKIVGDCQNLGAHGIIHLQTTLLALSFRLLLDFLKSTQRRIPVGFQCAGHQAVIGIHPPVPLSGQIGFILGTSYLFGA